MEVALINEKEWQALQSSINQILVVVQGLKTQGDKIMEELGENFFFVIKSRSDKPVEMTKTLLIENVRKETRFRISLEKV